MSEEEIANIVQRLTLQELISKQPTTSRKAPGLVKRRVEIESDDEEEDEDDE
jgi:hypothetical protein